MEEPFYQERLRKSFSIDVLVPKQTEQETVHRLIYRELCLRKIEQASRQTCLKIIKGLKEWGAKGVIWGCTELPLLIRPGDVQVRGLDDLILVGHSMGGINAIIYAARHYEKVSRLRIVGIGPEIA